MIYRSVYEIKSETGIKVDYNWGSVMHGLIMEQINESYAEYLHTTKINPYSQYIYCDRKKNKNYWIINYLEDESFDKISTRIKEKNYFLNNKDTEIQVEKIEETYKEYSEIFDKNFAHNYVQNSNKFNFVTPTSFKRKDKYINYPTTVNIYSNLMKKWDNFSDIKTYDKDVLEHIENMTYIKKYNLKSKMFYLEKTKIPSFIGEIEVALPISKELRRVCGLLNDFSIYSGVGIKTSIGMGGQINI